MIDALREGTRELHDRVEAGVGLPRDAAELAALLRRWLSVTRPLEVQLARWRDDLEDALGLDLDPRLRGEHLNADLRALGHDPATVADAPVPNLDTLPRAVGCLYVLEGSTLGGQIVARHLREQLGMTAQSGGSFFAGRGDAIVPMWRQLKAALSAYGEARSAAVEPAVAAARETFEAFGRAFAGA